MVITYAVITALAMLLQLALSLCLKFDWKTTNIVFADFINGNLVLPMEQVSWFWTAISAAYIGVDRVSYFVKTASEPAGQTDVGDPATLRRIILISGLLLLEAVVCNGFADADFQLSAFFTAFGTSVLLYVGGQKAIKTVKYVDGKLDANGDGIPDEEQVFDKYGNVISPKPGPSDQKDKREKDKDRKDTGCKCNCGESESSKNTYSENAPV